MKTTHVVTIGEKPLAVTDDLSAAQSVALTRQTQWASSDQYDYRWDEYLPGEVWRLMQRLKDRAGMGRRFSWTGYAVHTVESVTEATR
jgi:hypothetical protein